METSWPPAWTDDSDESVYETEEDEEHQDVHEREGMLYELNEPAILLTSKEIRNQCLPVYYAMNSFSWRFLWQQYKRSLRQFRGWAQNLRDEDARAITKLTFEGRHTVEEGVEWIVDIDLHQDLPWYSIEISTEHQYDLPLLAIHRAFNKDLMSELETWAAGARRRLRFTPDRVADLGEIFMEVMQRYAKHQ